MQSRISALVLGLALAGFACEGHKTKSEAKTPAADNAIHAEGGHDCAKHEGDCPKDAAGKETMDGKCCKKGHSLKVKAKGEAKAAAPASTATVAAVTPEAKPTEATKAPAQTP